MPLELPRIGVDRDCRIRVQVVALAIVAVPVRRGIACAPDDQVELGIVGTGHPGWRATVLPFVGGPGLISLLAGSGNCPKTPAALSGLDVIRVEESADSIFTARDACDDHVFDDQRS